MAGRGQPARGGTADRRARARPGRADPGAAAQHGVPDHRGRRVPRRPASGQRPAAHRRPPRPARFRLGRPPRHPAAGRAAEPAARGRARRPRGALLELVTRTDEIDEWQLERALGRFAARHLVGTSPPTAAMFTDLFRLASQFELAIPPEIATVLRALATLEGTLSLLTPGIDIAAEARQYAADRVASRLSPTAAPKSAAEEVAALLPVLRRLPRRFDRVTSAVEQGRLRLNVRLFADERDRRVVTGLTHQLLLTFLAAASGIVAAILLGTSSGPQISPTLSLLQLIGYNLLLVGGILGLRVLYVIFRNR